MLLSHAAEQLTPSGRTVACRHVFRLASQVLGFARTILTFLQHNCTTDNATYWLLRDASSDQVQLFDVSALLGKSQQDAAAEAASQRVTGSTAAPGSVRLPAANRGNTYEKACP